MTGLSPRPRPSAYRLLTVVVALIALFGASCGADSGSGNGGTSSGGGTAFVPTGNPSGGSDLPVVNVLDVATGAEVDVSTLAPSDKPILLWFYAPH